MRRRYSLWSQMIQALWRWDCRRLHRRIAKELPQTCHAAYASAVASMRAASCKDRIAKGECVRDKERCNAL